MKKEKLKRIARRITAFAAAVAMAATFTFPAELGDGFFDDFGNAIVASAETTTYDVNAKTIAGLGTSVIVDPTAPASSSDAWNGSYVYYGKYNSSPVKYRVLDASTTDYSADGTTQTMFLDCDCILYYMPFDSDGTANEDGKKASDWSISDVKSSLNGDGFLNKEGVFTTAEKNAIAASNVASHALTTNSATGVNVASWTQKNFENYVALTGEQIFLLDAEDVSNGAYGYRMMDNDCENRKKKGSSDDYWWWLRSATDSGYSVGYVLDDGNIGYNSVYSRRTGVSPALNLNLSSVLFSSVISGTAGETGAEYKLTLLDGDMTIAASGDVTRNGKTVTVPYSISGANSANATQVSVLILDKEYTAGNTNGATVLDYQKLNVDSFSASGTGTFTLPSGLTGTLGTDYHIYLLAEQVNAHNSTDYASEPVKVEKIYLDISEATVVQSNTLTYDNTAQTPTFTVTLGNTTLTADDYDVTVTAQTNAGSYTATITGKGNYTGTISNVTWSIGKKAADEVTSPTAATITYGQTLSEATLTSGWSWVDGTVIPTVINNGYAAEITVDDSNYDYTSIDGYNADTHKITRTIAVTVEKATPPALTIPTATTITYGEKLSASTLSDSSWAWVDGTIVPTVKNSGYDAKMTVDDSNYDYTDVEGYDSTNHTVTRTISVTVTPAQAKVLTVPSAIKNLVYDGNAKALVSAGTVSGGTMVYSLDRVSFSETIPTATEAGTYTVHYKASGDETHSDSAVGQVSVTIESAAEIITGITVSNTAVVVTYGYEGTTITARTENVAFENVTVEMVEWMKNSNIQLVIDFVNYSTAGSDTIILTSAQMKAIEYVLAHDFGM